MYDAFECTHYAPHNCTIKLTTVVGTNLKHSGSLNKVAIIMLWTTGTYGCSYSPTTNLPTDLLYQVFKL